MLGEIERTCSVASILLKSIPCSTLQPMVASRFLWMAGFTYGRPAFGVSMRNDLEAVHIGARVLQSQFVLPYSRVVVATRL